MNSETLLGDDYAGDKYTTDKYAAGSDFDDDFEPIDIQGAPELPAQRFIDRELSWLAFNQRVLELAEDEMLPVLERANFLAIFASNLDEFFMVRVAGLKSRVRAGMTVLSPLGQSTEEVLVAISNSVRELQQRHAACYRELVRPVLAENRIRIIDIDELSDADREVLHEYFTRQIFPVLMPLAVDPSHPFPYISGLSLNISVRVRNPNTGRGEFARVKVPQMLPRFLPVNPNDPENDLYVTLESLISAHLDELFVGMEIVNHNVFRVTRNEDFEVDGDGGENLLLTIEKELLRRRFGPPVRLEVSADMDEVTLDLLVRELEVQPADVYKLSSPLDLTGLFDLAKLPRPELHYPPYLPVTAAAFRPAETEGRASLFDAISRRDVLVHHPYESFATSVQQFLEQAATDPQVLAIKQTLYRTSGDSPIVGALIQAAESGKQVLALVELKARFDEQANITWARKLEKAGVHVIYGMVGLKTHCKLALVVRQEGSLLRYYSHIGTGNYHPKTSRMYEDLGLFTADDQIGKDISRLFNELSGYAIEKKFRKILVAPRYLRNGLLKYIDAEESAAREGAPSRIRLKLNSLVDEAIIDALYRAAKAGTAVDVWVRGMCSLRPGVPGLSENIRVRSILGRYLEHSRVFWFENRGNPRVLIGSADMMHRNLDRRVEALVRISDPGHHQQLEELFDLAFDDGTSSWQLCEDGRWERHSTSEYGEPLIDLQARLMDEYSSLARRRWS